MVAPWAVALAVEWVAHRVGFRSELAARASAVDVTGERAPRAPLVVLALTLAGFAVTGPLGVDAAWPALGGATLMVALVRPSPLALVRAVDLPLLCFVLGLGIVVRGVAGHGLGDLVADVVPGGDGLLALLATAGIAAVLANLLNNVPGAARPPAGGGRRRAGDGPGGARGGQRGAEPHLHGLARDAALAARAPRPG